MLSQLGKPAPSLVRHVGAAAAENWLFIAFANGYG
jgi:hypothetical protein